VTDFYLLDEKLTDDERGIRDRLRDFCAREVTPVINDHWERAEFPLEITAMQLLCLRLSELTQDGRLAAGMASLAKLNHAAKAREIVGMAREITGLNAIRPYGLSVRPTV
jgi:hypothetical protein